MEFLINGHNLLSQKHKDGIGGQNFKEPTQSAENKSCKRGFLISPNNYWDNKWNWIGSLDQIDEVMDSCQFPDIDGCIVIILWILSFFVGNIQYSF